LVNSGALLPFGGAKGFGLGLMVEILSGVLTGSGFSHTVYSMYKDFERSGDNGHWFLALDIATFMPLQNYYERMETLVNWVKASGEGFEGMNVILPGENRWRAFEQTQTQGLRLDPHTQEALEQLSRQYAVPTPW
jgi:LDH2 family malate/lactate/ureidoglycolate dehydrogenase